MFDKYIMEDPRESQRLRDKVDPGAWLAKYRSLLPASAQTILDVGCGDGSLTQELAKVFPESTVVGIDLSDERYAQASLADSRLVRFMQGNVGALPFQSNEFGLVWSRFLLQFILDKAQAVREMVRVCQPGGTVFLQDLEGQLVWHYPQDHLLEKSLSEVIAGLARTGFDPHVGRKLFSLMHSAGLRNLRVSLDAYHLYAGSIDPHNLALWKTKFDIAQQTVVPMLGAQAADRLKNDFLNYLQRDDTLSFSVVFTVTGMKPENG